MITEFRFNLEDLPGMTAVERNKLSSLGIKTNLDLIKQITNSQQKRLQFNHIEETVVPATLPTKSYFFPQTKLIIFDKIGIN